ncbi:MAG: universal stress protein [Moraxellaceae bacterium]
MLPMKTLLVVMAAGHGAQPVWQQARAWAMAIGARLQVLVPVAPDVKPGLELAPGLKAMAAQNAETAARHWLEDELADAPEGTAHAVVATEHVLDTVLHEARRFEADLILMAAGDATALRPLLRQLPCPLLLVRRSTAPRRLAGALGAGNEDAPHRLLNLAVLEHLKALAAQFGAERRVLSALPNPTELVPLMGDAYAASYVASDLEQAYRQGIEKQVADFGMTSEVVVAPGRPDLVLPELVQREQIDLLLLGTVARQGLAAFWLGNTAEDILPRVEADVLVLRPQDYFDPA